MEAFEITEDDLRAEVSGMRGRGLKGKKKKKEDEIYGVFADEEYEETSSTPKGKRKTSTPLNFVKASGQSSMELDNDENEEEDADLEDIRPSFGRPKKQDADFGKWEQHTTGFGSKMLLKMGWKFGEGLGGEKKGIIKPVEIKVRPKKMGIAFGDFDELTENEKTKLKMKNDDLNEELKMQKKKKRQETWKKGVQKKVTYKTVTDILLEEGVQDIPQKLKIIDMRLGEAKEIELDQSLEDLKTDDTERPKYLHELRYNVSLITSRTGKNLHNLSAGLRNYQKELKSINEQISKMELIVANEPVKIKRMENIFQMMKELQIRARTAQKKLSPFEAADASLYGDIISKLSEEYMHEFKVNELDVGIVALISPLLKSGYVNWDPFKQPDLGIKVFEQWRSLFPQETSEDKQMNAYDTMMLNIWLPNVRSAISNYWNPRHPEELILFLQLWQSHLPNFILNNITHQLILPKLKKAIETWNPKIESTQLHTWIYPWLPLLKEELEPLFSNIRYRMASLLYGWTPADDTGFKMILPWKGVFSDKELISLLKKHVIPNLSTFLEKDFKVNPRKQDLKPLQNVLKWLPLIPLDSMITVLEDGFFHKWLHTLYRWLQIPNKTPEFYAEIGKWYTEWKQVFPEDVLNHPVAKSKLTAALNMMNYCMDNGSVSGFANDIYAVAIPPRKRDNEELQQVKKTLESKRVEISFKEVVEFFAAQNNLLFIPSGRSTSSGKQIFKLGDDLIYIENEVLFLESPRGSNRFLPVSLDSLGVNS